MMGRNSGFSQNPPSRTNQVLNYVALYAQDAWRVGPSLTLNIGVRWEPFLPMSNRDERVYLFDMDRYQRGNEEPGLSECAGRACISPVTRDIPGAPSRRANGRSLRRGSARSGGRQTTTSVRASWGMFYDTSHLFYNIGYQGMGQGVNIPNPAGGFDNPYLGYPGGNPYPRVLELTRESTFNQFSGYATYPLKTDPTVMHQWNLSVQRQAGPWLFAASYLGQPYGAPVGWPATEPGRVHPGPVDDRKRQSAPEAVPGRSRSKVVSSARWRLSPTPARRITRASLSRRSDVSARISACSRTGRSAKCEADQTDTQFSSGTTAVDPEHPEYDRGPCVSDRRHVVNLSSSISTPRIARWGILGPVISNWQFSPLIRWQSGGWSTPVTGVDTALTGQGDQRTVQVLDNPYADSRVESRPDGSPVSVVYLNRDAFAAPATGTYSSARPRSIRNPGAFTNDLGITRRFDVANGRGLQVRWEIFNFVNHVNYGAPNTALNSTNFGRITTTGDPRIMQFAFKFEF